MASQEEACLRHQRSRWMRHDAALWVRPDAARFLVPNANLVAAYPALERKYSQDQPRVPTGNPDGGQWTDGDGGSSGRPRVIIDTTHWGEESEASISDEAGSLDLFGIKPRESERGSIQLAGDPPDGLGGPDVEPPEIPKQRPVESWERTAAQRAIANWLVRHSITSEAAIGAIRSIEWLKGYEDAILAARCSENTRRASKRPQPQVWL